MNSMNKRYTSFLAGFFLLGFSVFAQNTETGLKNKINDYFRELNLPVTLSQPEYAKVDRVVISDEKKSVQVFGDEIFSSIPFSDKTVDQIYKNVRKLLPAKYKGYELTVLGSYYPIEKMIPNSRARKKDAEKLWKAKGHTPVWVTRESPLPEFTRGLRNRHLSVWASHGRYYRQEQGIWKWQRPNLFCTNEDLLTQTFVVPYLIPMLEHAGAYVFTPREHNWQKHEVIVDNDRPEENGRFEMTNKKHAWTGGPQRGFSYAPNQPLSDGENPFSMGTTILTQSVGKKSQASYARWTPNIPADGNYAVYVSYPQDANNVQDAAYTVVHQGIETTFHVNQRMGGSTWVYLGTFYFSKGQNPQNSVLLSNYSNDEGLVTADAVRFGGGMGNIVRGGSTSGMPRFLEGARYYGQWAGMPYDVYSSKQGTNDYADDINVRSRMTNYLAGGSDYLPSGSGLKVPIEASIAIHSDAGVRRNDSYVGTLGIYTTQTDDGVFPEGMSRLASRDLCDMMVTQAKEDLTRLFGNWSRRQLFDRNYSETRVPQIPSVIIETLSHQNFADMKKAHDPVFKFHLSRALYKGILKYTATQHDQDYTVQPLPVSECYTSIDVSRRTISLHWSPTPDPLEPSAKPSGYIVYTKIGEQDFDNGTYIRDPRFTIKATPNTLYSFKVCALNSGGSSLPSEELTAYIADDTRATIMIVNGFQRLAEPQPIDTDSQQGFDLSADPGIYQDAFPGYCGAQINFNRSASGREGPDGLGYSGNELSGMLIAGNTFDYPREHGKSIAAAGIYSFASCSREAVERGEVNLNDYNAVDLIMGLQRNDGYSLKDYKTFTLPLQNALKEYVRMQGNLLVSGAYIGSDMLGVDEQMFTQNILKFKTSGRVQANQIQTVTGMNTSCSLYNRLNEEHYTTTWVDCITPTHDSFAVMLYNNQVSAGIAYAGRDYRCMALGFPFECIQEDQTRDKMMAAILKFLLTK